jgi:peptidylprolyl isomerase
MKRLLALVLIAAPAVAQDPPPPVTPASIVAAAPKSEWKTIDPADLLVMTLAPDAAGNPRTVVIQLIPPPFSQGWVGNIRTLAKAHWWDGTSVYRVVDNWVTQWGDGEDDEAKAKPLPGGCGRCRRASILSIRPRVWLPE